MLKKWIRNTRMGYNSSQAGIMRRMLREEGAWQSHLVKTNEYIQQAVNLHHPKTIRILGSGWLLDVPLKFLTDRCEKVILTDITHPNQITNKYSGNKSVVFETLDITGGAANLCYNQKKSGIDINKLIYQVESINILHFEEDLVISDNLLSQLSILLTDYLLNRVKISDSQIISLTNAIQKKHLEMLPVNRSILITDYEEVYYDEQKKLVGSKPTVYIPLPTGTNKKEWNWNFDSKMMYKDDCKTILKVLAMQL